METDLTALPDPERLDREAETMERKARALRQIADGIRGLNGDAAALLLAPPQVVAAPLAPQGQAAVRAIVSARPGIWKVSDLKDAARARGFPISDTGVEKAVRRMLENGEAEKAGYGRYRFFARQEGGAGESAASDGALIPLRT